MSEGYSFQTGARRPLSPADYVLFSILFVVSASVGFYHAYRRRNHTSEFEFHFAAQTLHPIPVSMSLSATFFSAITILGVPADVYTYNTMFVWSIVASFIATIFVAHVFVPFFYGLQVKSCFQYIELRYDKPLRLVASSLFLVQYILYSSIVLYLPCLAMEAIMGVSLWYTMIIVCVVCALYTVLGGMRSVVWIDTIQFVIIIAGLLAALIGGSNALGGLHSAWRIALENQRIKIDDFSIDPKTRHSVWSVSIGFSVMLMYTYGISQVQIQRVCTLSTSRKATLASWLSFPMFALIQSLVCMTGFVMYAFYSTCDPVKYGIVNRNDQLLPLFVLDVLGSIPGMPGLFLACVFSGSLSTISSCLNTLSTILLEDFVRPFFCGEFAERRGLMLSRMLVFVLACFQFLSAFLFSTMSQMVLQFTNSVYAVISGPLMGLFVSGMFLPWTNKTGARVGLVVSLAVMLWLLIGSLVERPSGTPPLPTGISGCYWNMTDLDTHGTASTYNPNVTMPGINVTVAFTPNTTVITTVSEEPLLYNFYRMSYLWYTGLGMLINVFTTLVTSFLTGRTKPSTVNSRLICPVFDKLFPWLPEKIKQPLRCGMVYDKDERRMDLTRRKDNSKKQQKSETRLIEVL